MAGNVLMANLPLKLFSDRGFYVTIADADIESLKSLYTLFDKYLDHVLLKFEQNRMARIVHDSVNELFGKSFH